MTTRLIANKYREGKVKRTLKRELEVLEIVKGEANIAVEFSVYLTVIGSHIRSTARATGSSSPGVRFRQCIRSSEGS